MGAATAGTLVAVVAVGVGLMSAANAHAAPAPGAPPRVLNIVRTRLKPRTASAYATLENQIVRGYERAKVRLYWICLQSPKDPTDVLYLNLHESAEAADRARTIYQESVPRHTDLVAMQDRLHDLTAATTSTLTTRRDDVDRPPEDADFATMRVLRVATFQVRPGHEGNFLNAIRTSHAKEGSWLVYEANDASTYALITLKRTRLNRRDGPPVPRALRRLKGAYVSVETKTYEVRPLMSHVPREFAAANPQFWRTAVAATH